ncbi:MAG: transcription antitermination factor NusB [Bacilli bacterium]|nr:transcription antitermination factor NusB [Bacilli bacterium]
MKRTTTRKIAMMCLYNYSVSKSLDIDAVIGMFEEDYEYDKDYLNKLIECVLNKLSDIDYEIAKCLDNYSIDRLNLVDLNLVRMAIAEVKYLGCPIEVAINESLEIAKEYSETNDTKTSKFNNSLLDKIFIDLGLKNGK